MIYGVRKLSNGSLMIVETAISFNDQYIEIGDKRYLMSTGLLELMFKQRPDEAYVSADDLEHYEEILVTTNVHKRKYSSSESIRADEGSKYKDIIIKLLSSKESSLRRQSTSGSSLKRRKRTNTCSLPHFMIAKQNSRPDYIYWDDPNELVDRLRLLMASHAAGNLSHNNETMSIIEELREAKS